MASTAYESKGQPSERYRRRAIDHNIHDFKIRIFHLKEVVYDEEGSHRKMERPRRVEAALQDKVMGIEPLMGWDTKNLLMVHRVSQGEAPTMHRHRDGREDRKQRAAAQNPAADLAHLIQQIKMEDANHTPDAFWDHQRDQAAVADPHIYERVQQDVVIVADKNFHIILCKFQGSSCCCLTPPHAQRVRGESGVVACSAQGLEYKRHMTDGYIRQKHPGMDVDKARSLEEMEERHQCIAHYGTRAIKGHLNPDHVWPAVDTILGRVDPARLKKITAASYYVFSKRRCLGFGRESGASFSRIWNRKKTKNAACV
ncbi:hypothetical protein DL765_007013 [Monosporascus sp. GIB2]|nr:hypothetical protein DL765_007013 [Monosporascus sp. GIB2]